MPKYIAFLRAINVGGHTVTMAALREHFESLGFKNVETVIASGNVVFDTTSKTTATLERKIEAGLEKILGYEVGTFLRTPAELAALAAYEAFPRAEIDAPGATLFVSFLAGPPGAEGTRKLLALTSANDLFHVAGREAWWLRRAREEDFKSGFLEKALGQPATTRNVNTIRRIATKYC